MRCIRSSTKLILALSISSIVMFTFGAGGSSAGASGLSTRANCQTATALPAPIVTGAEISGKVLTVFGENFINGAKVLINGEKQKTRFESSVTLIAKKAGKKLKPGDNLQVRNPDGTTSPEFLYNQQPYEISVAANDVVYSPATDRLYASVTDQAPQYANSIAVIDARTTQVQATIPVGRKPTRLAFSDDYRFLYAVIEDGLKVQRVDLDSAGVDLEISLNAGFGVGDCPFAVTDVRVMPGHPRTIAVAYYCALRRHDPTVAIFDDGVRRPAVVDGLFNADTLCFGSSADALWGYDSKDSAFALSQFKIDEEGVSLVGKPVEGVLYAGNQKLEFANGLLYSTNGRAVHPESLTFEGRFLARETLTARSFALDVNAGRIYFGQRENFDLTILEFDLQTYSITRSYNANYGLVTDLAQMVRCGSAGLALLVPPQTASILGRIVIFPLSLMRPIANYERPQPLPIDQGVRRIPLPNYEIAYDASRQLFYASVPSLVGGYGNSIVKIDPVAGTVGDPVWAGSEPWQMAVTDDGQYLYTVLFGGRAIRRLRLPDLTFDIRFSLFNEGSFGQGPMSTTASEILTMPGQPESLIVARWGDHNHIQFDSDGVAVYDNGMKRPDSTSNEFFGSPAINTIQLSANGTAVYGLTTSNTSFAFTKMGLDSNGVRIIASKNDTGNSEVDKMRCQSGLCFTNTGLIIDAESQTRLGKFKFEESPLHFSFANAVAPDVPNNRVYFIVSFGPPVSSGVYVLAYDLNTWSQVASLRVLDEETAITSFWLWGNEQFAFSTGDEVVFLPKALLQAAAASPSRRYLGTE
jgi:YVTN family beta-propeller protein